MSIPKQASIWDDRRNTSRVRPVPADALPNALRALVRLRTEKPALVRWIEDGYPTMTSTSRASVSRTSDDAAG